MEGVKKNSNEWLGTVLVVVALVILAVVLGFALGSFDPGPAGRLP